jgi:hypothetical protein
MTVSDTVSAGVPLETSSRRAQQAQLGRTALLLHLLSMISAAVAVSPTLFGPRQSADVITFMAVIGSAAFAMNLWSVVVALRALRNMERFQLPVAVIAAFLIESSVICLLGWGQAPNWNYQIWLVSAGLAAGLPFFVPFFTLLTLLCVPLALWLARRLTGAETTGAEFWQRWRRSFFLCIAASSALLMPLPLFYYCATFCGEYWNDRPSWQAAVAARTPNLIRNFVSELSGEKSKLQFKLLAEGWMSSARLEEFAKQNTQIGALAVRGLMKSDRPLAMQYATAVADGKLHSGGSIGDVAAEVICNNASPAEIRGYLARDSSFRNALINRLSSSMRKEFIPDLDQIMAEKSPPRAPLLIAFAKMLSRDEIVKRWPEYLAHPDYTVRLDAAEAMYAFPSQEIWIDAAQSALASGNPLVWRALLNRICTTHRQNSPRLEDRRRWIETLLPLLDAPDLPRRRGALHWLASELNYPVLNEGTPTGIEDDAPADEPSAPETDDERRKSERLKEMARTWLAKHK